MMVLTRSRFAVWIGAVAALLAGCGGSQPPVGTPGATAQALTRGGHADLRTSWMLPGTRNGDLLYVSINTGSTGAVNVYSFPSEKKVGTLTGFVGLVDGECVDSDGDVFVDSWASYSSSTIYEFAHGGTEPIATLSAPGPVYACSVDPKTGNLAIVDYDGNDPYGRYLSLAVYTGAKGEPKVYYSSEFSMTGCSYDNRGNLYLSVYDVQSYDYELARLPYGGSSIGSISLGTRLYSGALFNPTVHWDGEHIAVSSYPEGSKLQESGTVSVYRLKIVGSRATVIGTTKLSSPKDRNDNPLWIRGAYIAGNFHYRGQDWAGLWPYPVGGEPTHQVKAEKNPFGVVVTALTVSAQTRTLVSAK